jgi:hypothetical protein
LQQDRLSLDNQRIRVTRSKADHDEGPWTLQAHFVGLLHAARGLLSAALNERDDGL